jgi:thiol-disulfide isomerase/thioredoxin
VRTDDSTKRDSFRKSTEWRHNATTGKTSLQTDQRMIEGDEVVDGKMRVHSLSGHERNHFFLNHNSGEEFADLSALSGLDSVADGRGFALLDYDRDGWQDVAVVNANAPLTQLYHNDIGRSPTAGGGMIAIRFVGGNTSASTSAFGNRDGYGAIIEVTLGRGGKLKREHRCGEGFAAQNSATMIVGIGKNALVPSIRVRWPSGKTFLLENVAEGTLVTTYENRPEKPFTQEPYRMNRPASVVPVAGMERFPVARTTGGKVSVYTTTATWCAACLSHLPELEYLKEKGVTVFGIPVDEGDSAEKLTAYIAKHNPAYEMLADLTSDEKKAVVSFVAKRMRTENPVLPSSVITDSAGNVLEVVRGIPTLSQVRKWEAKQ